ncbi:MAG TPA: hypothetical protein VJX67_16020 [Blastocatellia bacterium]|nr:hypothetical protein [Blastocatellia bacterium]
MRLTLAKALPGLGLVLLCTIHLCAIEGKAQVASAIFVRIDEASQGNWHGAYGADGYSISGGSQNVASYATFTVHNQQDHLWTGATADLRALQTADGAARLAASWSSPKPLTFDVSLIDGRAHQFAMYAVDWEGIGRAEAFQVLDASTGAVLDTQTISNFRGGVYLVWTLAGNVRIQVSQTSGPDAVVSGVFFDGASTIRASASFVRLDSDTGGNWRGTYGSDGRAIAGDTESPPAYATFSMEEEGTRTQAADMTEERALRPSSGNGRAASAWYSEHDLKFDIALSDQTPHQVALYAVDWDRLGYAEAIQVLDGGTGAVLDTQTLSSFENGVYLVWAITGHVRFIITADTGQKAVASGIFFGDQSAVASTAVFLRTDATTQENWRGVFGADGYALANDSRSIPSYALFTVQNQSKSNQPVSAGAAVAEDPHALLTAAGSARSGATWQGESGSSLDMDVSLTDGKRHQLALYLLDRDGGQRSELVQVLDAESQSVLDSESVSSFANGLYLVWELTGHVKIRISASSGPNAVASGVFFGGDGFVHSLATFLRPDRATKGNWRNAYGTEGHAIPNGRQSLPDYAIFAAGNASTLSWRAGMADIGAVKDPNGPGRIGTTWRGDPGLSFELNLTDNKPHQIALYALDFDHQGRSQMVRVADAATGAILDSRSITDFENGTYLVWIISGHVRIEVTGGAGSGAAVAAVFFGAARSISSKAAFVRIDSATQGNWRGVYGFDGYAIAHKAKKLPLYVSLALPGHGTWTRKADAGETRALQAVSGTGRIASAWYNNPELNLDVGFMGQIPHRIALYAVDWDGRGRSETVRITDAGTGTVLDTRVLSGFAEGVYLVWTITGHVRITVTLNNALATPQERHGAREAPNAVVSGMFFGGSEGSAPLGPHASRVQRHSQAKTSENRIWLR